VSDADASKLKFDVDTGTQRTHTFQAGDVVGEPIVVPRSATAAEDDWWLLAVAYLAAEQRCALVVLDATDPERPPVAIARTDTRFFPGCHASLTTRVAS
jgi:all-trans-8'-apo-beta-carotenal 15,15'-oxygenase